MEPSDEALLASARQGDRGALEVLLERHQRQVYRFGLKMCRDEEDAKDVLQDTLLAAARGVRDFRGASSLSTWLYTIARSFCVRHRRRSKFAPEEESSLSAGDGEVANQVVDPARPPDESLAGRQVEAALDSAIRSLEPMYREVLVLRDVEGLTAPEVAEVLGITTDAVKSRLHRARVTVREQIAPLLGVPEPTVKEPVAKEPPATGCPDILQLLSRHIEGEISGEICAQMERHISECGRCRAQCDSLRQTLTLCKQSPAPQVPAHVQDSVRAAVRSLLGS